MKPSRLNRVIGLSLGEGSLLAAEVAVAGKDDRPEVRQLAEFRYPEGVTPAQPAELGAALATFLRENKFSAKAAVVGLPAKWLIVKPKDVPPADPTTLAELLRLQAEGEFSSELKDMVYDYAADSSAGQPKSVLLIATPRRYVDAALALCDAAKLSLAAVMPSAVALGTASYAAATAAGGATRSPIVLSVGPAGSELTAQAGDAPAAIRTVRGAAGDKPFLGELRRAVSTLPAAPGGPASREMVLWGTDADVSALNGSLGFPVRSGDLPALGVTANGAASNGDGRRYAAAVALALSAMTDDRRAVDFLRPRLAAPKARRVPRWAIWAAVAVVAVIVVSVLAYNQLEHAQARLDQLNRELEATENHSKDATDFEQRVLFARGWHGGTPRYLACLSQLTEALPQDGQTYAISLTLNEPPRATGAAAIAAAAKTPNDQTPLQGRFEGKTSDQIRVQTVLERIKADKSFQNVTLTGSTRGTGKNPDVSFQIRFIYQPPKHPAAAATPH